MVSRIVSELLLIALIAGVIAVAAVATWIQYHGLEKSLEDTPRIVTLSYVTCNASAVLVYNYGYEGIEVREVYVNTTKTSFTLLVYDPGSKSWSPLTGISPRRLALIKVSSTLTSSTSITLITSKGVWSHACS